MPLRIHPDARIIWPPVRNCTAHSRANTPGMFGVKAPWINKACYAAHYRLTLAA
jgi:hypothetical protein